MYLCGHWFCMLASNSTSSSYNKVATYYSFQVDLLKMRSGFSSWITPDWPHICNIFLKVHTSKGCDFFPTSIPKLGNTGHWSHSPLGLNSERELGSIHAREDPLRICRCILVTTPLFNLSSFHQVWKGPLLCKSVRALRSTAIFEVSLASPHTTF